ncbi:MAG: SDR family oxidoreductase [Sandarakinorhabdus sp.]|nr:SDR family oxidoreductase [Sandarakinorhabdus sp.]
MRFPNLSFDYSGARVLVTGGTNGIGAAAAEAFVAAGAEVTITGTRARAGDYDRDLSAYAYLPMNAEDNGSIDAVAAHFDRLDVLVNNAGMSFAAKGENEYDPDIYARAITVLLTSAYRMANGCRDALHKSALPGGGSLVNIASLSSYFGMAFIPAYGSAKTGLVGMTRALAVAWGPLGIRVNAVAPGLVEPAMTAMTFEQPMWTDPMLARTPAGRLGQPEDVAAAILFLCSGGASWITGQVLPIDGGYTVSG